MYKVKRYSCGVSFKMKSVDESDFDKAYKVHIGNMDYDSKSNRISKVPFLLEFKILCSLKK